MHITTLPHDIKYPDSFSNCCYILFRSLILGIFDVNASFLECALFSIRLNLALLLIKNLQIIDDCFDLTYPTAIMADQ